MNIIQKALSLQGIDAAWQGDEPGDVMEITSDYLTEIINGKPRMIRSEDDDGRSVNIIQLRLDYSNLVDITLNERRIAAIKAKAGEIINSVAPDWKQRNMLARSIELVNLANDREYTVEEQAELDELNAFWSWVKLVRATSNAAETEGKQVYQVIWPQYNS
jgi:hypothetical protein